ncbi:hypothetical protein QFC22_000337 [Naganishia vaughanmartiniae]|uniref:Uncharacterized protein n=1 Tax=Naganishia vaughanmartiniae TaxID=1424756 RepID=A0ACC2XN20_9TREE|nr:hypothetical protein QFC22_000337 [Naganishia vaughanmartiniae]
MRITQYPEPGKIHKLPSTLDPNCLRLLEHDYKAIPGLTLHPLTVQIYYNIPSSDHTFVTTLDAAQSVFVHSAIDSQAPQTSRAARSESVSSRRDVHASGSRSRKRRKLDDHSEGYTPSRRGSGSAEEGNEEVGSDGNEDDDESEDEDEERWLVLGSTSLKAVMEGICEARQVNLFGPELVPSATSPDSSIYIPVQQPRASGSTTHALNTSSRHASATPGPAMLVPKIESQDPVQTVGSGPRSYPFGVPLHSPATGQFIYSHTQQPQPLSAVKRNNSTTSTQQASTPGRAPPSSPLPQRTVSTGSQAHTPGNAGLQTPTQTHANIVNAARGSLSNMPPPAMGQRTATTTGTPVPVTAQYPPPTHGQPHGYPYPAPYGGYPGHPQYPGYAPYPPHMQYGHPGYPQNGMPVPILVPIPGPQSHGQVASSSTPGPTSSPYPFHAMPNASYPHAMPGYPYPPAPYPQLRPTQRDHRTSDPSGVSNTLGIQSNNVTFQGKGLLSWILAERGDGKTLVKGKVVRCDGWDRLFGLGAVEDSDQSDDDSEEDHDDDHADAEGGLEALVKAASRRSERKRKREERQHGLAEHLDRNGPQNEREPRGNTKTRIRWGVEIRVNLRLMNGSLLSKVATDTLGKSPTVSKATASVSSRSVKNAVSLPSAKPTASTAGRVIAGLSASRAPPGASVQKSAAITSARPSMATTSAVGQTASVKQPASLINGSLQDLGSSRPALSSVSKHPATASKSKGPVALGDSATQTSNSSANLPPSASSNLLACKSGGISGAVGRTITRPHGRASAQPTSQTSSLALRRVHQNVENGGTPNDSTPGSTPTPSISIPSKTGITLDSALKTPPERSSAILQGGNKTPNGKPPNPAHTVSADRIDPLRTPRQGAHRTALSTPKSSPATGLALAKSILRYPASQQTIELAQKLVGKEIFQNIVSELGFNPAEIVRESPNKNKLSKLSENVVITARNPPAPTRVKAINSQENPLLDQADQARVSASGSLPSGTAGKQTALGKRVPSQPSEDPGAASSAVAPNTKPRILSCDHCKTTETRVWRVKQLPGGKERRVCDACGLYFNNTKKMRPKELWGTQKIELPGASVKTRQQVATVIDVSKGKEKEINGVSDTTIKPAPVTANHPTPPSAMPKTYDLNASPQRKARPSTSNAPDSVNWTPRRSSRLNRNADLSPTGRPPGSHHKPALDEICDAAMSPRRSTRLTPRKISKGKNKDVEMVATGKAQKRLMELTKDTSASSPRRSLTPALAAVAGTGTLDRQSGNTTRENIWDDNDFSFLLSDNIDEIQETGSFATDPMASSSGLDFEMEQFLSVSDQRTAANDFDPNVLLDQGESDDHEPKFTQKEMELLLMLSASGIASEEMGLDVEENLEVEPLNAVAGPSRQGHILLDGTEWADESSPWEISTPSAAQWRLT